MCVCVGGWVGRCDKEDGWGTPTVYYNSMHITEVTRDDIFMH